MKRPHYTSKNIFNKFVILSTIVFCLYNCSNKNHEIIIDSAFLNDNSVVIDHSITVVNKVQKAFFEKILLKSGNHSLSINGKETNFEITKNGLLNLNHQQFIVFPIRYENSESMSVRSFDLPLIVGDTMIIYSYAKNQSQLEKSLKNTRSSFLYSKDRITLTSNKDIFIPKTWDYTISTLPDKISNNHNSKDVKVILEVLDFYKLFKAGYYTGYKAEKLENENLKDLIIALSNKIQ
ncbi:hypothetical protein [Olleya sp. HaHaR_3_96]|uniref:hypothetical protein n=1 Tax=Olleya sp. HaHaR_3_96 TaxID=2745560 RepID=UPI001C4E8915|nr:hypothetical protein [Olleya sp. HaHaR_3_96]QXP61751.1 hypothetical protein H0I26_09025 [Olleya sp. HaHaR_3_96]